MGETDYDWDGLFDTNFDPISDPNTDSGGGIVYNDPFIPDTYGVDISSLTPDQQAEFNRLYSMNDDEFDAYIESLGLDTSGAAPMATGDVSSSTGFWDRLTNAFGNVAGTALTAAEKNALNLLQSKTTRTPQETAALQKIESDQQKNTLITIAVLLLGGYFVYRQIQK